MFLSKVIRLFILPKVRDIPRGIEINHMLLKEELYVIVFTLLSRHLLLQLVIEM